MIDIHFKYENILSYKVGFDPTDKKAYEKIEKELKDINPKFDRLVFKGPNIESTKLIDDKKEALDFIEFQIKNNRWR